MHRKAIFGTANNMKLWTISDIYPHHFNGVPGPQELGGAARFQEDIESSSWDFAGTVIKVSVCHKGVGGWKVSAKYSPISPHPYFSWQVFKIWLCIRFCLP